MKLVCRKVKRSDCRALLSFFEHLSEETKGRFGPHPFDLITIGAICENSYYSHQAFIGLHQNIIVAYVVSLKGYTRGDASRFQQYPIKANYERDYTIAPCVADTYQSKKVGSQIYQFVEQELKNSEAKRLILWGGVQESNFKAVKFYQKHDFYQVGKFHHNEIGNLDMMKELY